VLVGLVFGGAPARAALQFPFAGQLAPASGSFGHLEAGSVAVDDADGDTYVADSASGAVDVFVTASGTELPPLNGALAPAGSFGGGEIALAANNGTGKVYVLDSTDDVVDVFEASGAYVCQITGSATPSASECNGVAGSATPAGGFHEPHGIAVDQATGEVYVVDASNGVVDVFSGGGAYLRQLMLSSIAGGFSAGFVRSIAVDDFNGDVYVDSGHDVLAEFDAAGGYVTTWTGANTPAGSFGGFRISAAADDATGDVYVTDSESMVTDVFEPSGAYATQFGQSYYHAGSPPNLVRGTAVDQATGRIYVSDNEPSLVDIFGPPLLVPDVVTGEATGLATEGSVTLNGTVDPEGVQVTSCEFEYGPEESYGQMAECAAMPSGSAAVAVHADITGLTPGSVYHYRLLAGNANGSESGGDRTFFATTRPLIGGEATTGIVAGAATLNANINPEGLDTVYRFEWGTSTAYGASIPVPDGDVAAGRSGVAVSEHLTGLSANTTYRWRVFASNADGSSSTVDHTFVYDTGGSGLPDGREYEMVTPPQKNGALVDSALFAVPGDIAEDGSRVIVDSVQCFAGAESCTGNRPQLEGEPFAFTRTSGGWMTSAMAPPATRFNRDTYEAVSADAGTALFGMPSSPGGEDDLYVREPDGSFLEIGPRTPPAHGALGPLGYELAATADFSNVIYQEGGEGLWPFDATSRETGARSQYEYVGVGNAEPELVGVSGGLGSASLISVCGTDLGGTGPQGSGDIRVGALSGDGGTVFFTPYACASGSGVNAGVPVPAEELYARIDGSRTVLVSGRSRVDCESAECLGSSAGDAGFRGASEDGSKVFFVDGQRLLDSGSTGSENLYEYDFDNPAGENLIDVSAGDTSGGGPQVQGVVDVSPDGSHVYFVARGVLSGVANGEGQVAQAEADNLYVFERDASYPQGRVAFVATLPASDYRMWSAAVERPIANVTPDGRFLVFTSHGALTADDTSASGAAQVFRYDAQTGELVRISVGEHGFNDNGNADMGATGLGEAGIAEPDVIHAGFPRLDPTMSNDGSYVFFESPVGLTPQALNDVPTTNGAYAENVYEWREGKVYLISDGKDLGSLGYESSAVRLLGSDATGANVFFTTTESLVPQDTDTGTDIYDARICTASEPCVEPGPSPVACEGEACRGTPEGTPSLPGAASATFSGAGNAVAEASPVVKAKQKAKPRRPRKKRAKDKRKRAATGRGRHARGAKRSDVNAKRGRA
jgi:DNA-binding beta-propeller fold protein YncE